MVRILTGSFLSLFGILMCLALLTALMEQKNVISNIGGVIFGFIITLLGGLLIFLGQSFIKQRKKVIDIALRMQRENNQIEISKILDLCNIGETDVRKYLVYAQKKGWLVIEPYNIY